MRVSLISSLNLGDWYQTGNDSALTNIPLGIASLAAVLEKTGTEVTIVDLNYEVERETLRIDDDFYNEAARLIIKGDPDIVGFSTMCNSYHLTLAIANAVKKAAPKKPIIFGGPQASIVDEETLNAFPSVDMILRGEAERTLPELIKALENGGKLSDIPGLTFRSDGTVVRNEAVAPLADLNDLPIPAYHLLPYDIKSVANIDAGRGCPFTCNFCSTSGYWRRQTRLKPVERVIAEMEMLTREYDIDHFSLVHDMLTANKKWINDFCHSLKSNDMDVTWSCSARPDCVDKQMLEIMAEAGCQGIYFGIETGSPRMQKKTGKMLDLSHVVPNIEAASKTGMKTIASFITGFPEENEDDLLQTLNLIQELASHKGIILQLHLLAPVKETVYYSEYCDELRFDGFFSDFVGPGLNANDANWFKEFPDMFTSFYYYDNTALSRDTLINFDKYTTVFCSVFRENLYEISKGDLNLWDLYGLWTEWNAISSPETDNRSTPFDQFIMRFYDYLHDLGQKDLIAFDSGQTRDRILEFFFNHYHEVPVFQKDFPAVTNTEKNN
ncbi:MAG: radical SAM protein [bacterium]|nr:radical SAM protein [bacterium]